MRKRRERGKEREEERDTETERHRLCDHPIGLWLPKQDKLQWKKAECQAEPAGGHVYPSMCSVHESLHTVNKARALLKGKHGA